jgi:hypothetical protein
MSATREPPEARRLRRWATTPVAGAVAGILFSVCFALSVGIIHDSVNDPQLKTGTWLDTHEGRMRFAVGLVPFAGLFFLWFIAVARERLGRFEDQFFATVFLGSGLLFLALIFTAAALAGALVSSFEQAPAAFGASTTYVFSRHLIGEVYNTYALRMAAVFQISQATLWLRTGVMPKYLAYPTYLVALVLLFVTTQAIWVVLVFPAWVFLISLYILVTHLRSGARV